MSRTSFLQDALFENAFTPEMLTSVRDEASWALRTSEHAASARHAFALTRQSGRNLDFGAAIVVPLTSEGDRLADAMTTVFRVGPDVLAVEADSVKSARLCVWYAIAGVRVIALDTPA